MSLKSMVKINVKHKDTIDFDVIEFRNWNVNNHFPLIRNGNIFSFLGKDIIWPVICITPESDSFFSGSISKILRTVVSASDTVDINPFVNLFISSTDTNEQISWIWVIEVVSILTSSWVDKLAWWNNVR